MNDSYTLDFYKKLWSQYLDCARSGYKPPFGEAASAYTRIFNKAPLPIMEVWDIIRELAGVNVLNCSKCNKATNHYCNEYSTTNVCLECPRPTHEVLDVLFQQQAGENTKIMVEVVELSTGVITSYQHHYGMFFRLSECPKPGDKLVIL